MSPFSADLGTQLPSSRQHTEHRHVRLAISTLLADDADYVAALFDFFSLPHMVAYMSRPSKGLNLEYLEIGLIKGLGDRGVSQQEIIARFSYPHRTVHHNLISEIVRREVYGSDTDYPPAPTSMIDTFLRYSDGSDYRSFWKLVWPTTLTHSPSTPFSFSYRYHPVGQGIFCSGRISRQRKPDFRWVYDCGTDNGMKNVKRGDHVRREIAALKDEHSATDVPHLDLVTLSHFDTDHLSGLLDLISEFTIGTLLLPYLTPWNRLTVALIEDAAVDSDLLNFLVAPTAFLLDRAGEGRIGRIVLVQGGGEGPALPPLRPPGELPLEGVERDPVGTIIIKEEDAPYKDEAGGAGPDSGLASEQVGMLCRGGSITVDHAWEFVPYNDARPASLADSTFVAKARPLAAQPDRSFPYAARKTALEALKALYVSTFKAAGAKTATAKQRNEISLFLYSGPIGRVELLAIDENILRHRLDPLPATPSCLWSGSDRFGQIFTGDGYLQTNRQWGDFQIFFRAHDRLYRGAIFQVMHHGSEANWRPEIAGTIEPVASIFCSDPGHKLGHPDWPVLDSFSAHNPKQIDLFHGWQVSGIYHFA